MNTSVARRQVRYINPGDMILYNAMPGLVISKIYLKQSDSFYIAICCVNEHGSHFILDRIHRAPLADLYCVK